MTDRETRSKPKKTVIGSFLGRLSRSKSRGAEVVDRKKDTSTNEKPPVPSSRSDGNIKSASNRRSSETSHRVPEAAANFLVEEARMSPARRLLNRFSTLRATGKFKSSTSSRGASSDSLNASTTNGFSDKATSEHDLHTIISTKPSRSLAPTSGVPTGAQSETDLRFVTSRDTHKSIPLNEPFGFSDKSPRAFMSENDLSSGATADFPEVQRTPSYLRISCALNGYTRSPKADLTPKAPTVLGESIVERRTRMFSQPQERKPAPGFGSPLTTTLTSESKTSEIECLTPTTTSVPLHNNRLNALQRDEMGNHVSTPGPIRDLISKFDQLDLCSAHKNNEKEGVENIEPHKFIINQQPGFDEIDLKKDANGNDEDKEEPNLKISIDAESDSGISGSSPASSKRNVEILKDTKEDEVTTSTPSDGHEFRSLHDRVKAELQTKMDAAHKDLENADVYPEKCADSLRAAHGNAHLLVRKKFAKFNELIDKNLNPIPDDTMPVTVQDLEGFWMTIDMELKGILKEFTKVEKYRAANWDPSAVEEEEPVVDTTATTLPKSSRPMTAKKIAPVVSEETKKKLAEQKALAEQRRAEMRAQMRQKMKAKNQTEEESKPPVLGASEDC